MPEGPKGETRPVDMIAKAVRVTQVATGEAEEESKGQADGHAPSQGQFFFA